GTGGAGRGDAIDDTRRHLVAAPLVRRLLHVKARVPLGSCPAASPSAAWRRPPFSASISPSMDTTTPTPPLDENKLIAERREKLAAIRAQGGVAFPNDFKPANRAADLVARYGQLTNEELEPQDIQVSVGGRM